jgi:hypothetical protein
MVTLTESVILVFSAGDGSANWNMGRPRFMKAFL